MIQISSLVWAIAIFFAMIGFIRGWNRELIATAGIVLALFVLFQLDSLLRGYLFIIMDRESVFIAQTAIFVFLTYFVYHAPDFDDPRDRVSMTEGMLGGVLGFINGYLIGGALWYFLDINEYPFPQFVTAPGVNSPSAEAIGQIPLVLVGGGASGTGDFLAVIVVALLFVALLMM